MIVNAAKNFTLAGNYLTPSLPQSNNIINCLFQINIFRAFCYSTPTDRHSDINKRMATF